MVFTSVTRRLRAEANSRAAHAFQDAVISASPDLILVFDTATRTMVWSNRDVSELLGYVTARAREASQIGVFMPEEDKSQFAGAIAQAADTPDGAITQFSHRLIRADGTAQWFSQRITPLNRDVNGRVTQVVVALRDITDAIALEKRLEHYSLHDHLTGLPNRALLLDRLDAALLRSGHEGREVAVLFCDLDGFKRVNDNAGHAAGDAVLVEVAHRLKQVIRGDDTVARVGGDEFVIVVEPWNRIDSPPAHAARRGPLAATDRSLAVLVADRVHRALRRPIEVGEMSHVVGASIGITFSRLASHQGVAAATADEVLGDADAAMYEAKRRGKARYEIFEGRLRANLAERSRVEQALLVALEHAEKIMADPDWRSAGHWPAGFSSAYQPIYDSASGELVGFEALARLTDPAGGKIPPDVFIVVAEETGLIQRVGASMLEMACAQLARWRSVQPEIESVTMAVNVSAMQAQHSSLTDAVRLALARNGLGPQDLVLELTETSLLQAARSTIKSLGALREEGVGIAIDDFGTGYASLRYLATMPVSAVKVDRSFTAGLPGDQTCRKIVNAVAGLAADMDLACIVEGVETAAQRAALPPNVQLQGWLTGRAESPASVDLVSMLRREPTPA